MSMTKTLAKFLKTADTAQVGIKRDMLRRWNEQERNSMVRSSIQTQIRMCEAELTRRGA